MHDALLQSILILSGHATFRQTGHALSAHARGTADASNTDHVTPTPHAAIWTFRRTGHARGVRVDTASNTRDAWRTADASGTLRNANRTRLKAEILEKEGKGGSPTGRHSSAKANPWHRR